ncbi:MAG: hypothetical protein JWN31_606 [Frankiales bacterium]|nr:hypothetical protein [Frankiales bacterium]
MRRTALAALVAVALAGCGTTVPLAQQPTSAAGGDGLSVGSGPTAEATGTTALPQPGQPLAGLPQPSAVPGSGSTASTTTVRITTGALKPGAPVEVGIAYAPNAAAFGQALGGSLDLGDGKAQSDAVVAYVNAHGGLAGHPIKPVYYAVDLTRTNPWAIFVQEACSLWTEDHHVIAAVFPVNIDVAQLSACLRKHGAVLDASSLWLRSQSDYSAGPLLVEPSMITVERLAPLYIRGLQQQGHFAGKPVIGLLSYDYPQSRLFAKLITAEVKKIGLSVKVTFEAQYAESTAGLGTTIAQVQSSVLRFRSAGVTHLLSSAIPGGIGVAFQPAAQSQGYHPRYGLTSFDALAGMPANQTANALAVGWWLHDADARHEIANPTTKLCRSVFRSNGSADTRDKELLAVVYCDFLLLLQHTAQGLQPGARLDGVELTRRLDVTGASFQSSRGLGTLLSSSRRDGATGLRGMHFDLPCSCWLYGPRI